MPHETDLPCPDCGSDLEERSVAASDLTPGAALEDRVTVAVCPACDATYYPDRTLSRLFSTASR
ncbi:hypothetical protein [Halomicrobium salinisoli]|uniref:hypothetical protein n=1 Tax=Halomicrobium salinisoli TaxID=2878391 RepID=UPI001CEFEB56|nr:hypothetical protein [Halomicrobium salinisoli]